MACDPATLVTQAQCISTCIPPGMQPAVLIYLLCQIMQNGGGGGGGASCGCVLFGHYGGNPPPNPPPNPANAAIAYDLDPPTAQWRWNGVAWF